MTAPGPWRNLAPAERWGYVVWGLGVAVILVPELTAASGVQKLWPTISTTIGHLESQHSWVALIVVAVIVFVAYHVVQLPAAGGGVLDRGKSDRPPLLRTEGGRLTQVRSEANPAEHDVLPGWTVALGAVVVAGVSGVVSVFTDGFYLAYAMYSLIALTFIVAPNLVAYFVPREVPYPTFFRSLAYLRERAHFVVVLLVIGLVILLIHLALYPWPGIFDKVGPAVNAP